MDIVSFLKMESYRKWILYVSWKWSLTGNGYCMFLENGVLPEMDIKCLLSFMLYIYSTLFSYLSSVVISSWHWGLYMSFSLSLYSLAYLTHTLTHLFRCLLVEYIQLLFLLTQDSHLYWIMFGAGSEFFSHQYLLVFLTLFTCVIYFVSNGYFLHSTPFLFYLCILFFTFYILTLTFTIVV